MFNENFSFGASPRPSSIAGNLEECTSGEISPFTSRSPSPHSRAAATRRDSRFDTYRLPAAPRVPSITALTAQLQSQELSDASMRSASPPLSELASPSSASDTDTDEGFYDGPETPDTILSDDSFEAIEVDPIFWDLSMSDSMVATSSPRPSLSLEAQALSSHTMRRRQRQALVRLQCLATRAPDLAMLIEECHPSSLPLETETARAYSSKGRSESICGYGALAGTSNGRIEKERSGSLAAVRKAPRMRKRTSTTVGTTR